MSIKLDYLTPLIQVFNMPRSLAFYRDILGFQIVSDSGDGDDSSWVWIAKDGCHLMLNDQYEPAHVPETPPVDRVTWHKDTCLYLGCAELDDVYAYLRSKGIECERPIETSYGMKQLYVSDPDNYNLCFQCPVGD